MKRLILFLALLCPKVLHAQAAPLKLSATYQGGWGQSHGYEECKGEGSLSFKFEGDLAPFELHYWNATTKRWAGYGQVSLQVSPTVHCTRDIGMSEAQKGIKPVFSSVFDQTGLKGYASVAFEEQEDGAIRYRINIGLKGGSCKVTMWSYEIDGSSRKTESGWPLGLWLEETAPDGGEHDITPNTPFTKQDLAKGFNRQAKLEAAPDFCGSTYGNGDETGYWTWSMSYSPNASTATLALNVCSDVVVGSATNMRATATPSGGKFTFKSNKPDVVQVLPMGSNATVTALQPGSATVDVEYESPKGERATASEVINCVQVKDVNKGAPVLLGLYDAKGNKKEAKIDVPIEVLPAENARRVIFKPTNPALVSALASDANSLTITALKPGTTTVQGVTSCGAKTGPALSVEIVPCDDKVVAELSASEKGLRSRIESAVREMTTITGDDEFERAAKEGPEHIKELAQKTIELLGKLALKGNAKASGGMYERMKQVSRGMTEAERFAKGIDQISDAMAAGEMLEAELNGDFETMSKKAAEMALDKRMDMVTGDWWGTLKTARDAAVTSGHVGQDLGTMMGAAERLAELEEQVNKTASELDEVWRIKKLCKLPVSKPQTKPDPKPEPAKQQSAKKPPQTASGKAPQPLDVKDAPAEGDKTSGPPKEPPPAPPAQSNSFALYADDVKQCKETTTGAQNLFGAYAKQAEATQQAFKDFIAAAKLPEADRRAKFEAVRSVMKENPPSQFIAFAQKFETLGSEAESCAPKLQNSFEVKIEDLKTKY